MKRTLLSALILFLSLGAYAQCVPDHDFGDEAFGVYPDPTEGETFDDAMVNMPYADTIHLIVPSSASDIDEGFPDLPIDSVKLETVSLVLGEETFTAMEIGMDFACNNGGVSDDPCTVLGGQQGCGSIFGTPNTAGLFDVTVEVTIFVSLFNEVQSFPFTFEDYTFFVEGTTNLTEIASVDFSDSQNKPNPFNTSSTIEFHMNQPGPVKLEVMNLIGETVLSKTTNGIRGTNTLKLEAQDFTPGVYLYRLEHGTVVTTYRMVVSR